MNQRVYSKNLINPAVQFGVGKHILRVIKSDPTPPQTLIALFKVLFAESLIWAFTIPVIKLSILLFYRRIFTTNERWFRWATAIMIAETIAWMVATAVLTVMNCSPVHYFWEQPYLFLKLETPSQGSCLDFAHVQIPPSALNTAGDVILLFLPAPLLLRLQMPWSRKFAVFFSFTLGGLYVFPPALRRQTKQMLTNPVPSVCVASSIRLHYITTGGVSIDPTWDDAEMLLWGPVECCLGVVCACMPYLVPYRRLFRSHPSNQASNERNNDSLLASPSWMGRRPSTTGASRKDKAGASVESELGLWTAELGDLRAKCNDGNERSVTIQRAAVRSEDGLDKHVPGNRIKVSSDLQWKSEAKEVGQAL